LDAVVFNGSRGRLPFTGFQQIGPDRYVIAGTWPTPRPVSTGPSMAVAEPAPETPKSPASALWPNLPSAG
jgi:hypothetical protein